MVGKMLTRGEIQLLRQWDETDGCMDKDVHAAIERHRPPRMEDETETIDEDVDIEECLSQSA